MINQFKFIDAVNGANPELNFDIELEPDKQVYCFIGKNAVGKTKMLETLAKSLLYCHTIFEKKKRNNESFSGIRLKIPLPELFDDRLFVMPKKEAIIQGNVIKSTEKDFTHTALKQVHTSRTSPYRFDLPMIFIGARGRGFIDQDSKYSNQISFPGNANERFVEAFNRLFESVNTREVPGHEIISWFMQRIGLNQAFVGNGKYFFEEAVLVLQLMQKLESTKRWVYPNETGGNTYHIGIVDGKLSIAGHIMNSIPSGYASIVRLFQEIIAGYGAWQSVIDSKTPVLETKGVVFIDEIEAHLHAEWQSKIIPLLKESFPNTTFYIATHSPMVVATTEENESYELERGKDNIIRARNLGSPHDWYLSDLYNNGFHVNLDKVKKTTARKEKPLTDLITEFSNSVQQFKRTRTEASKKSAEKLYALITKRIPLTDPRRTTIDTLKGMVQ